MAAPIPFTANQTLFPGLAEVLAVAFYCNSCTSVRGGPFFNRYIVTVARDLSS
jgi:hypothetical protein